MQADAMTTPELLFFDGYEDALPVYRELRQRLLDLYPAVTVKVSKTQISFINRHIFAMASLPRKMAKGGSRTRLLVCFGLPRKSNSPRIEQVSEPYPGRFTHHVIVENTEQLDQELMSLIDEAYRFSAIK